MSLKIDDLLLLADVHRAGSLTAGAKRLGMPKATVSRRLAALEASVGTRVFVPGARRLQLTEFGHELADRAARHRDDIEDTRHWIGAQETAPTGRLRIAVPAEFATLLMAESMARFVQRYPEVQLEVDTSPRPVDLNNEPVDLLIRLGPLPDSNLVARRLMVLERGLYASPSHLAVRSAPRTPADLRRQQFVVLAQAQGHLQRLQWGRRSAEVVPNGPMQCNSIGLTRALALAGGGIASFPHGMVRTDVEAGTLVAVLPQWQFEPLPVSLLTSSRKLLPAKTRAFIEHLFETRPAWAQPA